MNYPFKSESSVILLLILVILRRIKDMKVLDLYLKLK